MRSIPSTFPLAVHPGFRPRIRLLVKNWLQLLRVPNLFTVPGDPIAGFLLAYGSAASGRAFLDWRAAYAVVASLCLYSAGLVLNDLFDLDEDRRDRPNRPLASGAIPARAAWIAAAILSIAGVAAMYDVAGVAGLNAAVALLGAICLYNRVTKHLPVIGALNMGLCRGLSLMLGAVAFTGQIWPQAPLVVLGAIVITGYIAAVTNLARHETKSTTPPFARSLPALVTGFAFLLFFAVPTQRYSAMFLGIAFIMVLIEIGRLFRKDPPPLPPVIGALIRVLLPIQAAFCVAVPISQTTQATAIVLLLLTPVAQIVGRRFYAS